MSTIALNFCRSAPFVRVQYPTANRFSVREATGLMLTRLFRMHGTNAAVLFNVI